MTEPTIPKLFSCCRHCDYMVFDNHIHECPEGCNADE